VLIDLMRSMSGIGLLAPEGEAPKSFMDALPDPMKINWEALLFVMVLVTLLYLFLKIAFFKPIIQVMDERDAAIASGAGRRAEAAALVERRQAEYASRLKDLRGQAFEHRKSLAAAAGQERQTLLEKARAESQAARAQALAELEAAQAAAKADLLAQVDTLSESMVSHLLRQA